MSSSVGLQVPANRWSDQDAKDLSEQALLLYRSNLLGQDMAVTNFGGGNTSAKITMTDPLTRQETPVLWVKGSGGDLGSMKMDGFASLYLDKLLALEALYTGPDGEDDMVAFLPHCTYNLNVRAASIDTPLHAFLPFIHIDHTHPDAVIAIAAAKDGARLMKEIYGNDLAWLPWQRPGFDLGLRLRDCVRDNPAIKGIILEGHGLFSWGDTAKACYDNTVSIIAKAAHYLNEQSNSQRAFGGAAFESQPMANRRLLAGQMALAIRAQIGASSPKVGHYNDSPAVLQFVNSHDLERLAGIGTSCPDHFLRTKIRPLIVTSEEWQRDGEAALITKLETYREDYGDYYQRCKRDNSPAMRDPNPIIFLIPTIGMLSFARDKATARIASEFYVNAINVMRGAEAVSHYQGLDEQEAFDIEYWLLEEAKLQRMPKPKPMVGKVAFITGAAGGIGKASAIRLLEEGACVALTDIDEEALRATEQELVQRYGVDHVMAGGCDVTSEDQVAQALNDTALAFGGLDIIVLNAGIASAAALEETDLALWRRNYAVLAEGYFLVAREAFKRLKSIGGSMVFVVSKNAMAASPNASAYASAKAASLHLARCVALEGAPHGIRVNIVNPDAVVSGSKIWTGRWRQERAAAHGIAEDQLEDHYRQRSMLKRAVLPEDVAQAVFYFASDASAKSTGNILNVDAGNAGAFPR